MNSYRLLSVTTGISACVLTTVYNFLTVKAQPKSGKRKHSEDLDTEECVKTKCPEDLGTEESPKMVKRIKVPVPYVDLEDDVFEDEPPLEPQASRQEQLPEDLVERWKRRIDLEDENKARFAQQDLVTWTSYEDSGIIFPHPRYPKREILEYKNFAVCYDNETRAPCWVLEKLTDDNFNPKWDEVLLSPPIRDDRRVRWKFRAETEDFELANKMVKMQHLAPFELYRDPKDVCVTTNMVAQIIHSENPTQITVWDELCEYIGNLKSAFPFIYILSGPLCVLEKEKDGRKTMKYYLVGNKPIPITPYFFKVILTQHADKSFGLECYVFPNINDRGTVDIRKFAVSRKVLEKMTGFLIFDKVKDSCITRTRPLERFCASI